MSDFSKPTVQHIILSLKNACRKVANLRIRTLRVRRFHIVLAHCFAKVLLFLQFSKQFYFYFSGKPHNRDVSRCFFAISSNFFVLF